MSIRLPVKLSERQYERLIEQEALVCHRCGAIGPYTGTCDDGADHELITIVDAEASGVIDVDFGDEAD